jgi:hypothetical protein
MASVNKQYLEKSIRAHVSVDVIRASFLDDLAKISDNDIAGMVAFMGNVNAISPGVFKEANEFTAQGVADPQVLALFTPTSAFSNAGNGLEAIGSTLNVVAGDGIKVNTNVSINLAPNSGLALNNGLTLNPTVAGNGINLTNGVLSINLALNSGLLLDNGLTLNPTVAGNGINLTNGVLSINFSNVFIDAPTGGTAITSLEQLLGAANIGLPIIPAIKALQTSDATKFDTAGNGLITSGTTVNINPGNGITISSNQVTVQAYTGITVDSNGVSLTYQVGDLTTMAGSPTSVVEKLGTSALDTIDQTVIGGINELRYNVTNLDYCTFGWTPLSACTAFGGFIYGPLYFYVRDHIINGLSNITMANAVSCGQTVSATGYFIVCCNGKEWAANGNTCLLPRVDSILGLANYTLQTTDQTVIGGINELLSDTTDLNTNIGDVTTIKLDGATPATSITNAIGTGPLNSFLLSRTSLTKATNAVFAQAPAFLTALCFSSHVNSLNNLLFEILITPTQINVADVVCLNYIAIIATGTSTSPTVKGTDAASCLLNVGETVNAATDSNLKDIFQETSLYPLGTILAQEICAQFSV